MNAIYSTLVVRLHHAGKFTSSKRWRNAADIRVAAGQFLGFMMKERSSRVTEILVHAPGKMDDNTKVLVMTYIHNHLVAWARPTVAVHRGKKYVCLSCSHTLGDPQVIQIQLERHETDIVCPICEKRVPLIDLKERKLGSEKIREVVRKLDQRELMEIDNETREMILVEQVTSLAASAGQTFRPTANSDWGIDGESEFKDNQRLATGERLYLQLRSAHSHLSKRRGTARKSSGSRIRNMRNTGILKHTP